MLFPSFAMLGVLVVLAFPVVVAALDGVLEVYWVVIILVGFSFSFWSKDEIEDLLSLGALGLGIDCCSFWHLGYACSAVGVVIFVLQEAVEWLRSILLLLILLVLRFSCHFYVCVCEQFVQLLLNVRRQLIVGIVVHF